ncbi:MAG: alanine--tRNA ligase [Chitinophagaceae bacterium]
MTSSDIRRTFLNYFKSKNHHVVSSAPIVLKNDPTLMFTNAGMNQFKDYFLGNQKAPYSRVANTQKCLRVSGKHNDLEEVGVDTYHHTMFEMLGNWSFGDPARPAGGYFKKEAIAWSWELLTEQFGILKEQLYVTVFEGNKAEGIAKDTEAINEWEKWIDESRILEFGKKNNFWEMGDTGPCGPCTEIHVDTRSEEERKKTDGITLVNADHPQVIEIWNNVFIQYNRLNDGSLQQLPQKHVDTGMGFERLVRVLQQKDSNYDTDIFTGTIKKIEEITNKAYSPAPTPKGIHSDNSCNVGERNTQPSLVQDADENLGFSKSEVSAKMASPAWGGREGAVAFRVLSDHIRAIAFTIADGQLPSNTGAGYVIRRILRRAVRYYYSYLDYKQPLLHQLVPVIANQFEEVFPEVKQQEDFITKVIREEEESFLRTLEQGIKKFEYFAFARTNSKVLTSRKIHDPGLPHKKFSGWDAFLLYDSYGFPVDLTNLMAKEKGFEGVDMEDFENLLKQQKERSRSAVATETGDWVIVHEGNSKFVGYDFLKAKSRVLRYRKLKAKGRELFQLVLSQTPFYAESGGQVGDTGKLIVGSSEFEIIDTKKENELTIHFAEHLPENSDEVIAIVDEEKRKRTAIHHTATHLLHAALRTVLGKHVTQKGSLVTSDYLRFDFSHFSKLKDEEASKVEQLVNQKIRQNIPVVIKEMPKEEALKSGAMALFGEKYAEAVRVVIIDPQYSIELCGGTHVGATGELGFFKIISESAIAAGVRRIDAVSGDAAEKFVMEQLDLIRSIRDNLNNPKDVTKAITSLREENVALKKQAEKLEQTQLKLLRDQLVAKAQLINGCNFIGEVIEVNNADALKKLAFSLKPLVNNYIITLVAVIEDKSHVILLFEEAIAAQKNLDASATVKQKIASLIKGGGGGQKTLATAGGTNTTDLQIVIDAVRQLLKNS